MGNEKIAIIGSIGCGKTVLLTVLAHRYQKPSPEGYQILPDNQEANLFCLRNWDRLQGGEWPEPTPPEENPPVYRWKLRFGKKEKVMVTSDVAGEAWRSFILNNVEEFESNSSLSTWNALRKKWKAVPSSLSQIMLENHLLTVESLLNEASSIYYLLDLGQIINKETGYEEAMWLPCALEKYMKRIGKKDVPVTLVLSKEDEYHYEFKEKKQSDWNSILKDYIPWLPQYANIVSVAAVAKTRIKNERPIPASNFTSNGLEILYASIWDTMAGAKTRSLKRESKRSIWFGIPLFIVLWIIGKFVICPISLTAAFYYTALVAVVFLVYITYKIIKIYFGR